MEVVTPRENTLRGIGPSAVNKCKTHCKHGHPFSNENTYRALDGRRCKLCGNIRNRAYYERVQLRRRCNPNAVEG
jgi:hypothetical protein